MFDSVTASPRRSRDFRGQNTCVRALIGRHMASFATRINPIATSSMLIPDVLLLEWLAPVLPTCGDKTQSKA